MASFMLGVCVSLVNATLFTAAAFTTDATRLFTLAAGFIGLGCLGLIYTVELYDLLIDRYYVG